MGGLTPKQESGAGSAAWFATTHWRVVLVAGHGTAPGAQEALETLCQAYGYPLYAYVRRHGHAPEEAQDLTQDFFAHFLEKNYFKLADPARGRFRTFLLTALKHFLANDWKKVHRQRRGSGQAMISLDAEVAEQRYATKPVEETNPETIYERRWAATLLEGVLEFLREECAARGQGLAVRGTEGEPVGREQRLVVRGHRVASWDHEIAVKLAAQPVAAAVPGVAARRDRAHGGLPGGGR
jgi:DNA-directed RNA polymerase specialized sigma24 family protein